MAEPNAAGEYRVLARKYRPRTFAELIGQEAMVRTLGNAIDTGRIAHAFLMTGVRGVGKTSTARLIARALNCIGPDGNGGPTVTPCGVCDACKSIAESRHVDIIEMDAASRTGVDDIREIIDGVQYSSVSARFKIYIIDEVHMLSRNAFNALLKTLEEPPPHVKFIFATTEVRKLPVTVLSRCQRFDLRRVPSEQLIAHFARICGLEGVTAEESALTLIARASEGSVRDGLSLLDQAIAHGGGQVTEAQVRDMLGLADRARSLDLFRALMAGDAKSALAHFADQYDLGADPLAMLQDLLEVAHWLTRLKVVPDAGSDALVSESERKGGDEMAGRLSLAHLSRAWQMLIKGVKEVQDASNSHAATEMVLIRICHAADLPDPADLVRQLKDGERRNGAAAPAAQAPTGGGSVRAEAPRTAQVVALRKDMDAPAASHPMPVNYERVVELFDREKEGVLATHLRDNCRLVSYAPGRLELRVSSAVPRDFLGRVKSCLEAWTGSAWLVTLSAAEGEKSLRQQEEDRFEQAKARAASDPVVAAVLLAFPGAEIVAVDDLEADAAAEAAADVDRAGETLDTEIDLLTRDFE